MKKNSSYYIGNILIIIALGILVYIFFPLIPIYLFPPKLMPPPKKGFFITIPSIHAQAPIIKNVDPWNENEYMKALKRGVAQAKSSSLPGNKGTIFLFAHSSGMPWDITHYNTIFLRLPELKKKDTIILSLNGKQYTYSVYAKKEVWPNQIDVLNKNSFIKNGLILQTCVPIGTSLKRLLVYANPV